MIKDNHNNYSNWVSDIEPLRVTDNQLEKSSDVIVSIVLATNDLSRTRTLNSILTQSSSSWELIIVTDQEYSETNSPLLNDLRIINLKVDDLDFYDACNSAATIATGDFLVFLNEGDLLASNAIAEIRIAVLKNSLTKIIYSDEDLLNESSQRIDPFFKPDWNFDYLINYNYFSLAVVYEYKLFLDTGGFKSDEKDPYHYLALKAVKELGSNRITHVDKVLFHFNHKPTRHVQQTTYQIPSPQPLVSVIVPTKDNLSLLKACIDGLLKDTSYSNFEVIIIDNKSQENTTHAYLEEMSNRSNVKLLQYPYDFNYSDMNNKAVGVASGSMLCFLNNDVSVVHSNWLTEMVSQACRSEIGCVGAKLLYPDDTIQHAGVILGLKGYASHAHKGFSKDSTGYFERLNVVHNVSAVTAACLVVEKEIFMKTGGFDAINLKVAYNDVDLCLKVLDAGYRNLYTPHAVLVHHESKSRGKKRNKKQKKQLKQESEYLANKWGDILLNDPAYNRNLTLLSEDFSLGFYRVINK